ncbi:MAG: hypothetical protein K2Y05_04805 [Hyphomicrobiaceae bacterium]|nr:hypothetical protein [Hyphomicrobiaceae bacterium]
MREKRVGWTLTLWLMAGVVLSISAIAWASRRAGNTGGLASARTLSASVVTRIAGGVTQLALPQVLRNKSLAAWRSRFPVETVNAAETVEAMIDRTRERLRQLKQPGPLSDVLSSELMAIEARLASVRSSSAEGDTRNLAPTFRNLVRDVERIGRIIDGAVLTLERGDPASRATQIPSTRAEAYGLLGLNPDAPDGTLKKVADGLRMSWHPDHARDDDDRRSREARVKAINTAVDLINGKRAAT